MARILTNISQMGIFEVKITKGLLLRCGKKNVFLIILTATAVVAWADKKNAPIVRTVVIGIHLTVVIRNVSREAIYVIK